MKLASPTRYYIYKLLRQHATELSIGTGKTVYIVDLLDQALENLYLEGATATTKVPELEDLARQHQDFIAQGNLSLVTKLEQRIFSLLGFKLVTTQTFLESDPNGLVAASSSSTSNVTQLSQDQVQAPLVSPLVQPKASPPESNNLAEGTLDAYLSALNRLSLFTQKYLGTKVVVHYWKVSRPTGSWVKKFEIAHSGEATFNGPTDSPLTFEQQQQLSQWIQGFGERCSRVIHDFPQTLLKEGLTTTEQQLLQVHQAHQDRDRKSADYKGELTLW